MTAKGAFTPHNSSGPPTGPTNNQFHDYSAQQVTAHKWTVPPSTAPHLTSFPPSPAHTTAMGPSSKDPSKLSKSELLRLYNTAVAKNDTLTKKCGQYLRVSCGEVCQTLIACGRYPLILGKMHKKYKGVKKALEANQGSGEPAKRELIPYPTGKTPGRGDFNLLDYVGVSKEEYNALIVCNVTPFKFARRLSFPNLCRRRSILRWLLPVSRARPFGEMFERDPSRIFLMLYVFPMQPAAGLLTWYILRSVSSTPGLGNT